MKPLSILMMSIFCTGMLGCTGSITDAIVDNEVTKTLAEENKNLPQDLGNGLRLMKVTYNAEQNQLTMHYTVEDPARFNQAIDKVRFETKKRVRNNGGLQRALDNNIQVFHEFKSVGGGDIIESFETPKE